MDGIRLLKPGDWVDRSMIAYNAPQPTKAGVAPNVVVTSDRFPPQPGGDVDARLKAFAARQVVDMRNQLASPVIHYQQMNQIADRRAAEVLLSWQSGRIRLTQWVFFIARDDERVVIVTATSAEADFADNRDVFGDMIQAIEFDG